MFLEFAISDDADLLTVWNLRLTESVSTVNYFDQYIIERQAEYLKLQDMAISKE